MRASLFYRTGPRSRALWSLEFPEIPPRLLDLVAARPDQVNIGTAESPAFRYSEVLDLRRFEAHDGRRDSVHGHRARARQNQVVMNADPARIERSLAADAPRAPGNRVIRR